MSGLRKRHARSLGAVLGLLIGIASAPGAAAQEAKKPKEGSKELLVTGCLKGRVLTVVRNPNETGAVIVGADVVGRSFRLTAQKSVMQDIKAHNGHFVEVAGLVRTSDLATPPGFNMGGTRVTIGPATGMGDPNRSSATTPVANVVVMDATAVRFVSDVCPIAKKN